MQIHSNKQEFDTWNNTRQQQEAVGTWDYKNPHQWAVVRHLSYVKTTPMGGSQKPVTTLSYPSDLSDVFEKTWSHLR